MNVRMLGLMLCLAAAVLSAGASCVSAQAVAIRLTVNVSGTFSIETSEIDFGRIVPGVAQTVLAQPGGGDGSAGRVYLSFNTQGVSVSVPSEMTLRGPGAQIRATLTCGATPSRQSSSATPFSCVEGFAFTSDSPDGRAAPVVYVGGVVPASETAGKPSGIYTGAVVVTANSTST